MRDSSPKSLFVLAVLLCFAAVAVLPAQAEGGSQTTVAASFYGAYNGTTEGNGTIQSPSNQAGGLFELRYLANPLIGYELTYSYNRANQSYNFSSVKAGAHQISADWVVSFPILNFRPFLLAGAGVIDFKPDSNQPGTSSDARVVYIYGGGLDWGILPHFGLRAQYRGNLYHAPDMLNTVSSTGAFTHTSEPVIGAYFRF
jgi:opacity protein-like surface antigen